MRTNKNKTSSHTSIAMSQSSTATMVLVPTCTAAVWRSSAGSCKATEKFSRPALNILNSRTYMNNDKCIECPPLIKYLVHWVGQGRHLCGALKLLCYILPYTFREHHFSWVCFYKHHFSEYASNSTGRVGSYVIFTKENKWRQQRIVSRCFKRVWRLSHMKWRKLTLTN